MTTNEIQATLQRYNERIEAILTPDELDVYKGYRQRVDQELAEKDADPITQNAEEQAVSDKIAADSQAAAINKQFLALIRVEHQRQ